MARIENDQFYTKHEIANDCFLVLKNKYPELLKNSFILEPSAGTGNFIDVFLNNNISKNRIMAFDIEPKHSLVKKKDFLKIKLSNKNIIAIGNPPFGKRAKLAISFFNHCAKYAHTIAFIVPVQFQKYGTQSKLDERFKLIYEKKLKPNSFEHDNKELSVRCCFQIWTIKDNYKNKRLMTAPKTEIDDFIMYLYNNTPGTLKYFDYEWDFAVPRQGFYDYTLRIKNKSQLNPKIQYMFFKAKNKIILKRIMNIDYDKLSLNNTTIKGYGKADIIKEYERLYKC